MLLKDLPFLGFFKLDTTELKDWLKTLAWPPLQSPLQFGLGPKAATLPVTVNTGLCSTGVIRFTRCTISFSVLSMCPVSEIGSCILALMWDFHPCEISRPQGTDGCVAVTSADSGHRAEMTACGSSRLIGDPLQS